MSPRHLSKYSERKNRLKGDYLRFNNHLNFAYTRPIFAILFDEYRITWALTLVLHLIHIYQRLRIFHDKDRQKLVLLPRRCNWCLAETLRNRFVFLWLEIKSFTLFPSNLSPWRAGGARWRPVGPRDRPAWLSTPCSRCSSQTSPASPRPPSTPPWTLRLDQNSFLLLSYSTRNGNRAKSLFRRGRKVHCVNQ